LCKISISFRFSVRKKCKSERSKGIAKIADRSNNISLALTRDFFKSFGIIRDLRGKLLSGLVAMKEFIIFWVLALSVTNLAIELTYN
jgi:hypothetical protein